MKPVTVIEHQDVEMTLDEFYEEAKQSINEAQQWWCGRGLNCDWLGDVMAHGLQLFPVRTYEILRELNANVKGEL